MKKIIKEKDIQYSILEYLQIKKIFAWRNNSGMMRYKQGDKWYVMRTGPKGSSDIIGVLPDGRFLAIEVKKPGEELSPQQEEFIDRINSSGALGFMATSIDDVEKQFKKKVWIT